jgi:hypothetical protein
VPYRDISLVSIYDLHGTLHIRKDGNVKGVSVEGSYKADVVDGSWLKVYPEGQDLQTHRAARTDITAWGTHVGSVDVTARMRLLTDSGPFGRARTSAGEQATIRITVPPGTEVELVDCYGLLKYSRDRYFMRGSGRFGIR